MRFFFVVFALLILQQVTGATYKCNTTASCGCSGSSTVLTRIVGGEDAKQGTWTWAVSLREYKSHICGGSILTPLFIITAAHCIEPEVNIADLSILAGSITIEPSSSNKTYQTRSIAQAYKHPSYGTNRHANDIAILRLSSPLDMTKGNLKPICLPTGTTVQPPDNIDMIAIGWGVTSMNSYNNAPILQQVTVRSINNNVSGCNKSLDDSRYQFCAGLLNGTKDTCQGDSGGPIMSFVNGLWRLDGLTSYGDGCALANSPGIYTRVSAYINWIQTIIESSTTTTKKTATTTKKTSVNQQVTQRLSTNGINLLTKTTTSSKETLDSNKNSAQHSKIQSFFMTILMPIAISGYSFILLCLL